MRAQDTISTTLCTDGEGAMLWKERSLGSILVAWREAGLVKE